MERLFDTNILTDYLNGISQARNELTLYPDKFISIVTSMEILVGTDLAEQSAVDHFLLWFSISPLDTHVSIKAVALRKLTRLKLPDAVIWYAAQSHKLLLITRNSKVFSP